MRERLQVFWMRLTHAVKQRMQENEQAPDESTDKLTGAADPITALVPQEQETADGVFAALLGSRHSVQRLRVWTRRGMVICLLGALICTFAVPVLSSFRVKTIDVQGNEHHTTQEILAAAEVEVGDESLLCSPEAIRARILGSCSYVKDLQLSCGLSTVEIRLTECKPRWAWLRTDGQAVLWDEERYVAEICAVTDVPTDLCRLQMPPTAEEGDDESVPTAGEYFKGNDSIMKLLTQVESALDDTALPSPPVLLDMSDRYAVVLELADGTRIHLNECRQPMMQLRAVSRGIRVYLDTHPGVLDGSVLHVNVDDRLTVTVRPVPRQTLPESEKMEE